MLKKAKQLENKGFTLIEILVVLFIISLLMLLVLPNMGKYRTDAKSKTDEALVSTIQTQVELYMLENDTTDAPALADLGLTAKQMEAAAGITIDGNGNVRAPTGNSTP